MLDTDYIKIKQVKLPKADKDKHPHMERFEFGPLPKGFGYTIANSLRRVLLSSISGTAITSVRINDIEHEFTTLAGVKENILNVVLNLKQINFKSKEKGAYTISLSTSKVGKVKAGDFTLPSGVEIVNPELVVAEVTDKKAKHNIEAVVETGLG